MTKYSKTESYLWLNIADLAAIGSIGRFGNPLTLIIQPELNDRQLSGYVSHPKSLDESYVIVRGTKDRMITIQRAMQVISNREIRRKLRTRLTAKPPGMPWQWHRM